eukprot:TRINITY_DN51166_c0_g1_i1.p1 TRINITY_DN51166_c0_g1~~TRINITY_DN51166_c0_g1_i1.p1  ORF type:complete len:580 (+),score=96.97 TRINITY_DN51166_c0_g1_i1:39-1778(+)
MLTNGTDRLVPEAVVPEDFRDQSFGCDGRDAAHSQAIVHSSPPLQSRGFRQPQFESPRLGHGTAVLSPSPIQYGASPRGYPLRTPDSAGRNVLNCSVYSTPLVNYEPCDGTIVVPDRVGSDRTALIEFGGMRYRLQIPGDLRPGARLPVQLRAGASDSLTSTPLPPPLPGLGASDRQRSAGPSRAPVSWAGGDPALFVGDGEAGASGRERPPIPHPGAASTDVGWNGRDLEDELRHRQLDSAGWVMTHEAALSKYAEEREKLRSEKLCVDAEVAELQQEVEVLRVMQRTRSEISQRQEEKRRLKEEHERLLQELRALETPGGEEEDAQLRQQAEQEVKQRLDAVVRQEAASPDEPPVDVQTVFSPETISEAPKDRFSPPTEGEDNGVRRFMSPKITLRSPVLQTRTTRSTLPSRPTTSSQVSGPGASFTAAGAGANSNSNVSSAKQTPLLGFRPVLHTTRATVGGYTSGQSAAGASSSTRTPASDYRPVRNPRTSLGNVPVTSGATGAVWHPGSQFLPTTISAAAPGRPLRSSLGVSSQVVASQPTQPQPMGVVRRPAVVSVQMQVSPRVTLHGGVAKH